MRRMYRGRAHHDEGAALIMVLAFLLLVGVVSAVVAEYAFATYRASDATIELRDEVSSESDTLEQVTALLRDPPAGSPVRECQYGTAESQFMVEDAVRGRYLRVTCKVRETKKADFGAPFGIVLMKDSGEVVLEKNGTGEVSVTGDVLVRHPSVTHRVLCFRERSVDFFGNPMPCEQASSAAHNSGRLALRNGALARLASASRGNIWNGNVVGYDTGGNPLANPADVWRLADPASTNPDPNWSYPSTDHLPTNPAATLNCTLSGGTYWCNRWYQPGKYTGQLNFHVIDRTYNSGGLDCRVKTCRIRANVLAPGIYSFSTNQFVAPKSGFGIPDDQLDADIIAGTPANPESPTTPPVTDRCLDEQPGVALVFENGEGLYLGYIASGHFDDSAAFSACYARAEQLPRGQGRPGVVFYQQKGASHGWAIEAPQGELSAPLSLDGAVYAPDGGIDVVMGSAGRPAKFGEGVVAWTMRLYAKGAVQIQGGSSFDTQYSLDLTIDTCLEKPAPDWPPNVGNCDPKPGATVNAQFELGDDRGVTNWVSRYLPSS